MSLSSFHARLSQSYLCNEPMDSSTVNTINSSRSAPMALIHQFYLLLKAHYFLFFSAFGTIYPILSITLRSRGLTTNEVSYMNMIIPFLVFFTNPLSGFLADHSRRFLSTFNILLGTVALLYFVMFFLPAVREDHIRGNIIDDDQGGHALNFCVTQDIASSCISRSECGCDYQAKCSLLDNRTIDFSIRPHSGDHDQAVNPNPTDCHTDYRIPLTQAIVNQSVGIGRCEIRCSSKHVCRGALRPDQTWNIALYWLIFISGTNFLSNTISLGASIGFAALPRPDLFGEQRVFGTIGFGISAFIASRLYQYFHNEYVYIIMFTVATILCISVTSIIDIPSKRTTNNVNGIVNEGEMTNLNRMSPGGDPFEDKKFSRTSQFKIALLLPLLKRIDVLVFLSLTFIWGTSYAALDPYLYLYVDEIAPCRSRSIVGWMALIAASAEVLALFFAYRVIKFLGTNFSSIIILIAFTIRFAGYYLIRQPYFLLFMETMHFFNFGILYVLISQKADALAPPGLSSTFQGVVYGISFGLGRGVGLIVSSIIYTRNESRFLFLLFSIFNGISAILYSLYFLFCRLSSSKTKKFSKTLNIPKIVIESETNINEESIVPSSPTEKFYVKSIDT